MNVVGVEELSQEMPQGVRRNAPAYDHMRPARGVVRATVDASLTQHLGQLGYLRWNDYHRSRDHEHNRHPPHSAFRRDVSVAACADSGEMLRAEEMVGAAAYPNVVIVTTM